MTDVFKAMAGRRAKRLGHPTLRNWSEWLRCISPCIYRVRRGIVQEIGKAMEAVAPLRFDETDKLESVTLDKLEEKMRAKAPPFERLPILSAKGAPSMVVHRSVLNDFLLSKKTADPEKDAKDYNLSDLVKDYPWLQQDSFATVSPTASAAQAKDAMAQKKGCSDVFVTMDGTSATAVTRWITKVDLLQAAQV